MRGQQWEAMVGGFLSIIIIYAYFFTKIKGLHCTINNIAQERMYTSKKTHCVLHDYDCCNGGRPTSLNYLAVYSLAVCI